MKKHFKAITVGLILVFVFSRIYTVNPRTELLGDFGDKYEFFNYMYLVGENLREGKYALTRTDSLRYPNGFELGHGFDGVLSTFTGAALSFFLPLPLVYNLVLMMILFLNYFFSYLFFSTLTGSTIFGIFGGIFYGLSPYVLARINGHFNLAFIGGFPFLSLALLNFFRKKKSSFFAFFSIGLGILLIAAGSLQYLIITFWFLLFLGTVYLFLYPNDSINYFLSYLNIIRQKSRRYVPLIFLAAAIFLALGLYFYFGYAKGLLSGSFVYPFMYHKYVQCCLPQLSDILIPNQYLNKIFAIWNPSSSSVEKVVNPGIIGWIIFVLYFLKEKVNRRKVVILLALGIYLIASLGIIPLPYWPEGGRSIILFSFLLLIFMSGIPIFRERWFVYPVVILLILERLTFTIYRTVPLPLMEGKLISTLPGKALLNIPLSGTVAYRSIVPYLTGKKIVDGYFHDTAENSSTLSYFGQPLIERYFCNFEKVNTDKLEYQEKDRQNTLSLLRNWDIRTIVIHKNRQYEKFFYDECRNVRYWWYNLNPEKLILGEDTSGPVRNTISLFKYPFLKTGLYFKKPGVLTLEGIFISPKIYSNATIKVGGMIISPSWESVDNGIKSIFTLPVKVTVKAGDELILFSDREADETVYINFYYSFDDEENSAEILPPIERVYLSSDYEIFKVN
ncbi:hypothetical protein A3D78_02770 [Candidatus Gottesmanbacteria bacterium RIFCSPHIGHO2_02_FULL_39_14]|uniref:Uncharacterized protein n=1 Tax=Candidatus Gottesmanbacteria bacterium RIFCSPHIGHO2_02_FULL_39_14 TaxID=1798383 RepID=A0A1F5ZYW3_9BACT|nr:MAG: hypothetical protein A3D78_02770 [Candidatus Gottesmanbacteria bacterium RIFCSPHIGHO2_02_FULL_39_14]